ncbi:MAG: glycoside hydrolase family 18 protein [Chloroflexi bacterium]|nr:glycoside hydrolase family 18 protein [Chloroflexota bacterium]
MSTARILMVFLSLIMLSACMVSAPFDATPTARTPPPLATRTPLPTIALTATPTDQPASTSTPAPTVVPTVSIEQLAYRSVGYYPAWGISAHAYSAYSITANLVTHVIYAFGEIDLETSTCKYGDEYTDHKNLLDLGVVKRSYPHLQVLIALGGGTASTGFSDAALTADSRRAFVTSCLDLYLDTYPDVIDGVDIDWEFPGIGDASRPEDRRNLTLLMQEFRRQLDERGQRDKRSYLLTIAMPTGASLLPNYEIEELAQVADWFNLMAYDFHGAWSKTTNFHSPLFAVTDDAYPLNNDDAAVRAYLDAGVSPDKLVLGVPFYAHGWADVATENNGLYQRAPKLPKGTFDGSAYTYWDLAENYINRNGYVRYWSDEAKVPWLYSAADRIFITYDDAESIGFKADYVRDHHLGGMMMWNLSSDDGTLVRTVFEGLVTGDR